MDIPSDKYFMYIIFLCYSVLSWLSILHTKKILYDIKHPISLVLLTTLIGFIVTSMAITINILSSTKETIVDLRNVGFQNGIIFIVLTIAFTFGRIIFTSILKHHDPRIIRISSYIITTAVSAIALYLLHDKSFNTLNYMGFALMSMGGFLIIT